MLIGLFIFLLIVAAWYLLLALAPSQRALGRFIYNSRTPPDALNGAFPRDDIHHPAAADPETWPSVTIIVPGRNEGHLLGKTLGSLCAMDYPRFRVVFVDDQSNDNTAAVCRALESQHPHLQVIHNTQPPRDGWIGKTWAVHQAEPHMHDADYLLFSDSDLEFHPQCLKQAMRLALHRRADLFSLLPAIRYETTGELLGLLTAMMIVNIKLSLYVCNDPRRPESLVAGGFLLARREAYHDIGGHASVRGQVIEDVALGTRAKSLGKRVFTALTHDLYSARMYEGWADTFRGLRKNAYAGANYNPAFGAVILFFLVFFGAMPPFYAALGLYLAAAFPGPLTLGIAAAGVATFAGLLLQAWRTARFIHMPARVVATIPAGFLFYATVFAASMLGHHRGGNTWAGRRIDRPQRLAHAGRTEPDSRGT